MLNMIAVLVIHILFRFSIAFPFQCERHNRGWVRVCIQVFPEMMISQFLAGNVWRLSITVNIEMFNYSCFLFENFLFIHSEPVKVDIEFKNPLQIPISVSNITLICELSASSEEIKSGKLLSISFLYMININSSNSIEIEHCWN